MDSWILRRIFSLTVFLTIVQLSVQQFDFDKSNNLGFPFDNLPSRFDNYHDDHFSFSRKVYRTCNPLRGGLPNGIVKIRSNGRIARFSCNFGFELVGNRFTSCVRGRWDRELPVCVSGSCPTLPNDPRRKDHSLNEGRVIDVGCDLGYSLKLKPQNSTEDTKALDPGNNSKVKLYCVSGDWSVDMPSQSFSSIFSRNRNLVALAPEVGCEVPDNGNSSAVSHRCDYEESLCNWLQDYNDDFDWSRAQLSTPSHLDSTGPTHDHTMGANQTGWYLYIESSFPRSAGEKARLYSPVFHQNLTGVTQACFRFHYHMFGSAIGALRVFVLERAQVFSELQPKAELVGEQGNEWRLAEVQLKACDNCSQLTPFQIVLEGEVGRGHQGDIAIDDVHLMMGQECGGGNETVINIESDLQTDMKLEGVLNSTDSASSTTPSADKLTSGPLETTTVSLSSTTVSSVTDKISTTSTTTPSPTTTTIAPKRRNPFIDHITKITKNIQDKFKPKVNASTTTIAPPLTTTPLSTDIITTTDAGFDHMKWLNKLKEKLNKTRTSTTTTTPVSVVSSTTSAPLPVVSNISTAARVESLKISEVKEVNESSTAQKSSSWIVILCSLSLLGILIIALTIAVLSHDSSLGSLKFGSRNALREFVSASFVRRNGGRSAGNGDDDGELLVIQDGSNSGSIQSGLHQNEAFEDDYDVDDDRRQIYPQDNTSGSNGSNTNWSVYLR